MGKFLSILALLFVINANAQVATKVSPIDSPRVDRSLQIPQMAVGALLVNQPPNQVTGVFNDVDCDLCGTGVQVLADDFVLANAETIGQLVIWTGYFSGNIPLANDNWTVTVHNDNAGTPGTVAYTETNVPSVRMTTGVVLFGVDEYMTVLTLATPPDLAAGTYWLEIHNDSTGSAENVFWESGDPDVSNGAGTANEFFATEFPVVTWNPNSTIDFAFQIYAAAPPPVPVPSLNWLAVLLMVLTLGFFGRKLVK